MNKQICIEDFETWNLYRFWFDSQGTLPDGEEIAVKRMLKSSTQGVEELKNELALVAKLKHKNLVWLIGVCLEQQERLLVYEFVPNRSLDLILFGTTYTHRSARYFSFNFCARYI